MIEDRIKALKGLAKEVFDALEFHNNLSDSRDWNRANLQMAERVAMLEDKANAFDKLDKALTNSK